MRIDKYLWCIRFYKTRTIAAEACKKNHVRIDGSPLKPSKEIYGGEKLTIRHNQINYIIEVLEIPQNRVGAKIVDLYRRDLTPVSAFENKEALRLAQDYYRKKGTGRPTKKDRRDLEDYIDENESE
ncbi:RNA-binding S4 domain-containing protein [Namhaeicola litoreus]|uniref:RNA-binding S4 domain-containing protein n=1 Tax=Namhaeicola litoreus TaxID=1052145 RepID=A0ABW3Y3V6_9FLAO